MIILSIYLLLDHIFGVRGDPPTYKKTIDPFFPLEIILYFLFFC